MGLETQLLITRYFFQLSVIVVGFIEVFGVVVGDERGLFEGAGIVTTLPPIHHVVVVFQRLAVLLEREVTIAPVVLRLQAVQSVRKLIDVVREGPDGLIVLGIFKLHFRRPEIQAVFLRIVTLVAGHGFEEGEILVRIA